MRVYGESMSNVTIVEKILRYLTDKFNYIVYRYCGEESMHEQKFHRSNGEEQALKVTVDERNGGRGRGRSNYRCRGRGRGRQSFNKATVECYKCHNLGHYRYECPA